MQPISASHMQIAEDLADLIVDTLDERDRDGLLGEAEKALSYLRAAGSAERLATLLALRADRGQPFAQTRNIPYYYQQLSAFFAALRRTHPELAARDLAVVMGWAVRIARYRGRVNPAPVGRGGIAITDEDRRLPARSRPPQMRQEPSKPVLPKGPSLPAVGAVFTGKILEMDDRAAVIEVPGFPVEKAVAVLMKAEMAGKSFRVGYPARVEVLTSRVTKTDRVILEVKAAPKPAVG